MPHRRILVAAVTAGLLGCGSDEGPAGSGAGAKPIVFLDGPAPSPVFLAPADGATVSGGVLVHVDNRVDWSGLAENELVRWTHPTATIEVSSDGGSSFEVLADAVPLDETFDPVIGWTTAGLAPSPSNPENLHVLRATLTDDLGRTGSTEIQVRVNQPPYLGPILVEAIDTSTPDPTYTLSISGTDPDGPSESLSYEWHFQWDETTLEGPVVQKQMPIQLLERGEPLVVQVHAIDVALADEEGVGKVPPPDGTPLPRPTLIVDFCTCRTPIVAMPGEKVNTIPANLPQTEPARRNALVAAVDEDQKLKMKHVFEVRVPVRGDPKLCRHWQRARSEVEYRGVTVNWRERASKFPPPYHATDPAPMEGRECGMTDPFCLDGYHYLHDTPGLVSHRGGGKIIFHDDPGFRMPPEGMYDLDDKTPVGTRMVAEFEGRCVGTDGSEATEAYRWEGGVDANGNPTPEGSPVFTP